MYREAKNKNGFTLVEVILVLAVLGMIIAASINPIILGIKGHDVAVKEYDLQSAIRRAVDKTNQVIRYSRAVFAVPETFVSDTSKMDPGWNYLMVSKDGKKIVSMEYVKHDDGNEEFVEKILVPEHKNIRYEMFFEKTSGAAGDTVMDYVIYVYTTDEEGNETSEKIMFETTVETVNSVQVADKGTGIAKGAAPSIALAYRGDGSSATGRNEIVYITLVVDVSGSMNNTPDGEPAIVKDWWGNIIEIRDSRIELVKRALLEGRNKDDNEDDNENYNSMSIIEQFKQENIYVSLVPFSTSANYPSVVENKVSGAKHPIYCPYTGEVYTDNDKEYPKNFSNKHKNNLKDEIDARLKANGGTNTGDGLRRAYYLHKNFRNEMRVDKKIKIHHYMILLIDGESTMETTNKIKWINKGTSRNPKWEKDLENTVYYTQDGNISTTRRDLTETKRLYITGIDGNTFVGNDYVEVVGDLITNFDGGKGIKSYVIGFANGLTPNIKAIGDSLKTKEEFRFNYDDPDFDLEEVFQNIANDIMADYWMVAGPQIQN